MRRTECITHLNKILSYLYDSDCFEVISEELGLTEQELEIVLNSIIVDIEHDDF